MLVATLLVASGCSGGSDDVAGATAPATSTPVSVLPAASTTAAPSTTTTVPTTSTELPADARDPSCVVTVVAGDPLSNIADSAGGTTVEAIQYPTSTGEPGYETRDTKAVVAFRYDPALDNGGWHDSSRFPVDVDNPLNGNMYKPIYFNKGQAIHGANYVPPEPRSEGCARLFPWHQDELITWLGLDDVVEPTWRDAEIGVTVSVQGDYRSAD